LYKLVITDSYEKRLKRFLRRHPEMFERYGKAMKVLEIDPFHPSLRLHKLKGALREYWSVSMNLEYRVVIDFIVTDAEIIPIDIGTHDEVY
jgi:proteic killer suppression protein